MQWLLKTKHRLNTDTKFTSIVRMDEDSSPQMGNLQMNQVVSDSIEDVCSLWPEIYSMSNSEFKLKASSPPVRNNPDPVKILLSPLKVLIALNMTKILIFS